MTAITTKVIRANGALKVVATTASGRVRSVRVYSSNTTEAQHREAATQLSIDMGWGKNLVGGEVKEGFAYVPLQNSSAPSSEAVESAARTLMKAASAFPDGEKDPIRLAAGIMDLLKNK